MFPGDVDSSKYSQTQRKLKRVLVVGMTDSPHLKRWLDLVIELQIAKRIFVFPSTGYEKYIKAKSSKSKTRVSMAAPFTSTLFGRGCSYLLEKIFGISWRRALLNLALYKTRPQVVHIHEIQHGGYIFDRKVRNLSRIRWVICSSWGSDLILYGKLPSHKTRLIKFLSDVDFLLTERPEELEVASHLGFKGRFISPLYTAIGIDNDLIDMAATSKRNKIVIKGYQDNHGRALNALRALELVKSNLNNFEIRVVSASPEVEIEVERLRCARDWNIECLPKQNQGEIYNLLSLSRIYIGLSISDGLSTMMVEAMHFGAFPIQSINSGAPAFLIHGKSGFIVDPWDIQAISDSIDLALTSDTLVDHAAEVNCVCLKEKFNLDYGLNALRNLYLDLI